MCSDHIRTSLLQQQALFYEICVHSMHGEFINHSQRTCMSKRCHKDIIRCLLEPYISKK